MTITVNSSNPLSSAISFLGVASNGTLIDATGNRTVTGVGAAAATNARGDALVMGSGKYFTTSPQISITGRNGGGTGYSYMFVGDINSVPGNPGSFLASGTYANQIDSSGNFNAYDQGVQLVSGVNLFGANNVIIVASGNYNDQDFRIYKGSAQVFSRNTGLDGWGAITFDSLLGDSRYPTVNVLNGSANRIVVFNRKLTDAECLSLLANPDQIVAGLPAPATAPDAPTSIIATVGGAAGTASIAFAAPANDGGRTITGYTVTASSGQTATGVASPIVVSGLTGVPVTFTVKAANSIGAGPASAASNSITPTAAPVDTTAPTFISATTSIDGTGITITFNETLGAFTPATSAFPLAGKTIGGITRNGMTITLTGISPPYAYGDTPTLPYVKPATNQLRDLAGNETASFGPVGVTNARPAPPPPGTIIKKFGTASGSDYPDLNAAIDYANTVDCLATGQKVILEATSPVLSVNRTVSTNGNADCYIEIRPQASLGFTALNPSGAINETVAGLKMTFSAGSQLRMGRSTRVTGFIIDITTQQGIANASGGSGMSPRVLNCIVLPNADGAMASGNYIPMAFYDTLFVRTAACGGKFINGYWNIESRRNTFILKPGATASMAHDGGWNGEAAAENCAYYGFTGDPIPANYPNCSNCVTNSTLSYTSAGITSDTANPFFVNAANDYRASTALLGKGNYYAKGTADLRGDNRGPVADVGAIEGTPSLPFPRATVTSQVGPDGQSLRINFTYVNTADAGSAMLIPADSTSGAQQQGPFAAVLDTTAKTGYVQIDDIVPGIYLAPSLLLSNADGAIAAVGTLGFEIIGVDSVAEDATVSSPATAIVWSVPSSGTVAVASSSITVGLNGTSSTTIRATPNDGGAGGTFTPPYIDIVNGVGGTMTYTRPSAGTSTMSLANNGNLTNPASAQFVAAAPPAQAPTITISTTDTAIMSGKRATLSGAVNLQGDTTGQVNVFLDPQPSGASVALSGANVTSGTWTKQADIPAGLYKLRVVATSNSLSATVSTGDIRVLNLVGNFNLPAA